MGAATAAQSPVAEVTVQLVTVTYVAETSPVGIDTLFLDAPTQVSTPHSIVTSASDAASSDDRCSVSFATDATCLSQTSVIDVELLVGLALAELAVTAPSTKSAKTPTTTLSRCIFQSLHPRCRTARPATMRHSTHAIGQIHPIHEELRQMSHFRAELCVRQIGSYA